MTLGTNNAASRALDADPVPDDVAQTAEAARMGAFREFYATRKLNWAILVFNLVIGIAFSWMLLGLWLLWVVFHTPNLSKRAANRRVYLYDAGFVYADGAGGLDVYRWDTISTVFQLITSTSYYGVQTPTRYCYTVTRADGRTVRLASGYHGVATFGPHIAQQTARAQLPAVREALAQGQGVVFGDITVTAAGVGARRSTVPWAEIKGAKVVNGRVSISRQGKFMPLTSKPAAKIPNLPLFLALVEQYRQGARS